MKTEKKYVFDSKMFFYRSKTGTFHGLRNVYNKHIGYIHKGFYVEKDVIIYNKGVLYKGFHLASITL